MKSKKVLIVIVVVAIAIVAGIIWFNSVANMGSSNIFTESGGCISVSFDKREVKTVDKVVVSNGEKEVTIEDNTFVDRIVNETKVATHICRRCPEDKRIDLYCGDTLVRSMGWSTCCDTVRVYSADDTHWVFSIEGQEDEGYVYLSNALIRQLNDLFA